MLQLRVGARSQIESSGAHAIRTAIDPDTELLLLRQTVVFITALDADGYPRCMQLTGKPGFLCSNSSDGVAIDWAMTDTTVDQLQLQTGTPLALLFLDSPSGTVVRFNGWATDASTKRAELRITQLFSKAARYAHRRDNRQTRPATQPPVRDDAQSALTPSMIAFLETVDTLIVASRHPEPEKKDTHGLDLSHRGGLPGFALATTLSTITWPEFEGSNYFSTLGNLMLDPRCALLALSADGARALHIRGKAEILWNNGELETRTGTGRGVQLRVDQATFTANPFGAERTLLHYAPALARLTTRPVAAPPEREVRVTKKVAEADGATSYYLESASRQPLLPFLAGQHLALAVSGPEEHRTEDFRFYSLSAFSSLPRHYRITVKHGYDPEDANPEAFSRRLNDHVEPGKTLYISPPAGTFTLPAKLERPLVLLSAGIGITPMMAMLQEIAARVPDHPVWFFHGAPDGETRLFGDELAELRPRLGRAHWHTCFSRPGSSDLVGRDYDTHGRITLETLRDNLPFDGYDFYLCGPDGFLNMLYSGLRNLGITSGQIHVESFGIGDSPEAGNETIASAALPVPRRVHFAQSDVTVLWQPDDGTLLDLARTAGIDARFSCRTGMCGTCRRPLTSGRGAYLRPVSAPQVNGTILLCSAVPASDVEIDL
ncbi:MAG: 2Fe-2S iron-sulfur cluster-binding protein [Aquisalimonadaceae bacterium]